MNSTQDTRALLTLTSCRGQSRCYKNKQKKKRDSIYIQLCAAGNDNKHMKRSERGGTFATPPQSPEQAEIIKMSQSKTFGGSIKAHPHNTDLKKIEMDTWVSEVNKILERTKSNLQVS